MEITPGLHRIGEFDGEAMRREAEASGYTTFVLPQHGIVDRVSFFNAVRDTLPLDPVPESYHSWDALSDSLWEGLHTHSARRLAILWSNMREMAEAAPREHAIALEVLADVASSLADPEATVGSPKEVAVLVE